MTNSSLNIYDFSTAKKSQSLTKLLMAIVHQLLFFNDQANLGAAVYFIINEVKEVNSSNIYETSVGCDYVRGLIDKVMGQCEQLPKSKKEIYINFLSRLYSLFHFGNHKTIKESELGGERSLEILDILKLIDIDLSNQSNFK